MNLKTAVEGCKIPFAKSGVDTVLKVTCQVTFKTVSMDK